MTSTSFRKEVVHVETDAGKKITSRQMAGLVVVCVFKLPILKYCLQSMLDRSLQEMVSKPAKVLTSRNKIPLF